MVQVQLAKDWTDGNGGAHAAGEMVDVDPGTLAELEASGIVAAWPGPTGGGGSGTTWPGPTGGGSTAWPGPTGGDD